ncbi:MAG: DUF2062 domain-containing protein [Pseudomonadota bacterium]|nr:DUF2062 domain-containing protein [Pseudomonadota bacterium]
MPKHLLRRYLPTPEKVASIRGLGKLRPYLSDPNLWHLNRRSVSGAMYWGLFCAFLPIPMQIIPVTIGAILFRVNLPLSIVLVWITNPLTILPILYSAYWVGAWVMDVPMLEMRQISMLFGQLIRWVLQQGPNPFISDANALIIWPLLLGLLIEAIVASIVGGTVTRILWRWYVVHHWQKRKQRDQPTSPDSTP